MKVFLTSPLPGDAVDMLIRQGFDVSVFSKGRGIKKAELIKYASDADALITLLSDKIDGEILEKMPKCRIIANYAVGFNNIDIKAAAKKKIAVTNTPDILTDATADIAMALVLSCARNLIPGEKIVRTGRFKGWQAGLLLGMELRGKTFGIVGAGRIGCAVARRAKAFGTNIIYFNRSAKPDLEKETGAKKVSLKNLLKTADIVSLHLPLNEKTRHLLDKEHLSMLKTSSILVNTARGEITDEKELIKMLQQNRIFSAGFDVFENEPQINKELLKLPNVVLLPHIGSATFEARAKMAELCAENVINVLKGAKPLTPVYK